MRRPRVAIVVAAARRVSPPAACARPGRLLASLRRRRRAGESEAEAAARELAEETGLRSPVRDLSLGLGYDKPGGRVRVGMFAAEAPAGWEPVLDEEHVEYRWCSEPDALALLHYPEPRIALERAARLGEAS